MKKKEISKILILLVLVGCGRDEQNISHIVPKHSTHIVNQVPPVVQEEVPPQQEVGPIEIEEPEPDCSGLLEVRDIGSIGKKPVKSLGRFAAGSMVGSSFIPILYFNQLSQARDCVGDLEVREWRRGMWIHRS